MHQAGDNELSASHQHLRDADGTLPFNSLSLPCGSWQEKLGLAWKHREQSAGWVLGTELTASS